MVEGIILQKPSSTGSGVSLGTTALNTHQFARFLVLWFNQAWRQDEAQALKYSWRKIRLIPELKVFLLKNYTAPSPTTARVDLAPVILAGNKEAIKHKVSECSWEKKFLRRKRRPSSRQGPQIFCTLCYTTAAWWRHFIPKFLAVSSWHNIFEAHFTGGKQVSFNAVKSIKAVKDEWKHKYRKGKLRSSGWGRGACKPQAAPCL